MSKIKNKPPIPLFLETSFSAEVGTPLTVDLSATDPDGVVKSWVLTWGDGTSSAGTGTPSSAVHTYTVNGTFTLRLTVKDNQNASAWVQVNAFVTIPLPTPVPDPVPPPVSPDGTLIPPATQIVDVSQGIWTMTGQTILLNGGQAAGGLGSQILWVNSTIYVLGTDGNWWQWSGVGWLNVGATQPGTSPIPVPPPTPPTPLPPAPTPSPSPIPAGVLGPDDFTYLGAVGLPNLGEGGTRFGFSTGALSGRRVGSDLHLFVTQATQASGGSDAVAEVAYTGMGTRTTLVTNWGDVTKDTRVTGHGNSAPIQGLLWDEPTQRLIWAYGDGYNAGAPSWDPSIGQSALSGIDNTGVMAFGPWRTARYSQMTRGYLYALPESIQTFLSGGQRIASGAPISSGNQSSPYGAFATAWAPVADSTPPDVTSNTHVTLSPCVDLIYSDISNPQARIADTPRCGWLHYGEFDTFNAEPQKNPTQDGRGCTVNGELCGAGIDEAESVFNTIDTFTGATWIGGPSKQGVVYIGQVCRTLPGHTYAGDGRNHITYGPTQAPGQHLCAHGQNGYAYSQSTGDSTQTMLSSLYIYDPSDLIAVAQGSKSPIGMIPSTDGYDMSLLAHPNGEAFPQVAASIFVYGGCWFDSVSKQLFVTEVFADRSAFEAQPLIHVFAVNC